VINVAGKETGIMTKKVANRLLFLLIALGGAPCTWSANDWIQRTVVTLNTSSAGVVTQETQNNLVIPVRLHSGNFDFASAKPDGSDLWVMAGDDKTPLQFWVERFDGVNELGVIWVLVPSVLPATDKNTLYVYSGNNKPAAAASVVSSASAIVDAATLADFHFAEKDGIAADQSGAIKAGTATAVDANGLLGPSAKLDGTAVVWPATDKLKFAPGAPFTISLWVKPDTADGTLFKEGSLSVALAAGKLTVNAGGTSLAAGIVAPATWSHIALTGGSGKLVVYVNGAEAGNSALPGDVAVSGEIRVGEGVHGLVDELELASTARTAEWLKLSYAAQSADAKLLATKTETPDSAGSGGSTSYFGVLFKSLTPDAWAIIIILLIMFVIAVAVMVLKFLYVTRTEKANERFIALFRGSQDVMRVDAEADAVQLGDSSLYRLYKAGVGELLKRNIGSEGARLSGASMDAVKAAVDADSVREGYSLNSAMVLLTIAISGGPFLGLLGTVIGVMITFASIAAAGDVNVNAIAPGIAAALLATVAGLSVAIPSLFGYNYLASRIKTISSDMQIFIDEFVTRVAETYGDA
jgi:biopolymer transport protein ExbB